MQLTFLDLHRFEDARAQDVEPAAAIDQHQPNPNIADGWGDDNGETPNSLGALEVVSPTEGDRGFRPPWGLTRLKRRRGCADVMPEELKPPA